MTVTQLVQKDLRLCRFAGSLPTHGHSQYIPKKGELVCLSYIGNHAQGAVFHSLKLDTYDAVVNRLLECIETVDGFNYGRFDVRAASQEEFAKGNFIVFRGERNRFPLNKYI